MYRSIVVPLDGTDFGESALPLATSLAKSARATLNLVHVHMRELPHAYLQTFTPYAYQYVPDTGENRDAERRWSETSYLKTLADRFSADNELKANYLILDGTVSGALESAAAAIEADLIVMSTHARGAWGRMFLGGIADKLLHEVCIPLILVHGGGDGEEEARRGQIGKILVPLDGSSLAHQVIEHVEVLAKLTDAEVLLVAVIAPRPAEFSSRDSTDVVDPAEKMLPAYFAALKEQLEGHGIMAQYRIIVNPFPVRAILDCGITEQADFIALATHGRSGLKRLVVGSVADRLLRMSGAPLMVLRPKDVGGIATLATVGEKKN